MRIATPDVPGADFNYVLIARACLPDGRGFTTREPPPIRPPPAPLAFTNPATLDGLHIPERVWVVPGWLPAPAVTLHYAAGGEGKTLLAQQLMTSAATGTPWLGQPVTQCRAMGLFCKDDADEMHRRQDAICRSCGEGLRDLAYMRWSCRWPTTTPSSASRRTARR